MEVQVWTRLFARIVSFLSSLSAYLNKTPKQNSGGELPNVPANAAPSTLILKNATVLNVVRDPKKETTDAHFGVMAYNNQFIGFTMERKAVAIPEGTYHSYKAISPHFGFVTPHLIVHDRTYIEIHPANYPSQLEGCIAVGSSIDNDSLDNSDAAFQKMMAIVPNEFTVVVSSTSQ